MVCPDHKHTVHLDGAIHTRVTLNSDRLAEQPSLKSTSMLSNFKLFVPCILLTYEMKTQQMSLFQFYSYIDGSLHVWGLQAHPQENSHSCSHSHWTNGCVNSCVNSPEDGSVGPKRVEIHWYMNKIEIVTSVGFSFHMFKYMLCCHNTRTFLWCTR
jgi:hypothetical protein